MLCIHLEWRPAGQLPLFALHEDMSWKTNKQSNKHIFSCSPFTYFCLSLFLLLFVSHFSFVFCLICLPSANAFHPRVCGLQSLQPSGLQQPPAGRELRRLQQGNELMEGISGKQQQNGWAPVKEAICIFQNLITGLSNPDAHIEPDHQYLTNFNNPVIFIYLSIFF